MMSQLHAQVTTDQQLSVFNDAENAYAIGRLEYVDDLLTKNINLLRGTVRQGAYRLLALANLGLDDDADAEYYVSLLLKENPYYTTTPEDPQRFIDLVETMKSGMGATITTASSQAENLNESPVPVTLITEEMIINSGARNIKEVLLAYVPGMSDVDCNEDLNLSMRAMYSSTQEKILFLLDGHRLNSYTTNTASPDFSMSLEKVKQIEVLRGPASSLYGGVALSAVVNIITKNGADVDGVKVKGKLGNYGQIGGDFLFGKRYFDLDVLVWASIYKAKGQQRFMPLQDTGLMLKEGDITLGGIGNLPTYDLGLSLNWKGLSILYNTHFSQFIPPLSFRYTASPYDYGKYTTFNGKRPGTSTRSHHLDVGYTWSTDNLSLGGKLQYDESDMMRYNVVTDEKAEHLSEFIGLPDIPGVNVDSILSLYNGIYHYIDGQDRTVGIQLKGDFSYNLGEKHRGLISVGTEYDYYELLDVRYVLGHSYNQVLADMSQYLRGNLGKEHSIDAFAQLKHIWGNLILSAGLRYDYKKQYNNKIIHEFSPRVALIFLQPKWNVKLSYSRSFVDAPYLYRKTNDLLRASTDLLPEKLKSWQLTFQLVNPVPGLMVELNGFYNHSDDLIYANGFLHVNSNPYSTYGLELSSSYKSKRFSANFSMEVMRSEDAEYSTTLHPNRVLYIPNFTTNTVLAWEIVKNLKLHTHITTYSGQSGFIAHWNQSSEPQEFDVAGRVLVDAGANYKLGPLELGVNVHNLFDLKYYQGGMNSNGALLQQGRWVMADVAFKF